MGKGHKSPSKKTKNLTKKKSQGQRKKETTKKTKKSSHAVPKKVVATKTKQPRSTKKSRLRVAFVAPEAVPLVKVGGLADVVGSLPKALAGEGIETIVVIPGYRQVREAGFELQDTGIKISSPVGSNWLEASIELIEQNGIKYYLVRHDPFYNREGIYGTSNGDYPDNLERFSFFCKVVLELFKRIDFCPDVIHCNDWQTGLLPVFKEAFYGSDSFYSKTKTVFAIHNLAYQGLFPVEKFYLLGLDWSYFTYQGVEFYGRLNCLKAGLIYSDAIVTVSPRYAQEIQTPEYGYGLDGVLRAQKDKIIGILNGIDYDYWDPWKDKFIYSKFGLKAGKLYLKGKLTCKYRLLEELRMKAQDNLALIVMVSRLVEQKGVDLAVEAMRFILEKKKARFVVLGKGDSYYENMVSSLEREFPKLCRAVLRFDEALAHKLYAGADLVLVPSRYEPCGLSQMIAMRYGAIPVVRKTGGLIDTVPEKIGFLFDRPVVDELLSCLDTAIGAYSEGERSWKERIRLGMQQDFSWRNSAKKYIKLYKDLIKK